ncbi:iron complex outermembrane recepter protein [Flexibacter flexilis DSM 6793]|uniref:Iron complex outermembrane recepter protein n=1 Tax=Flexibacter flexilis DSM 6793 TaxID=927664 RepID=A0A1I1MCS8_9BACT|nr:TonB-dependent receptor plug domain-containing protein [Flexibacter flexilis]SFC82936.1 iron complex outermembrane recepter protein [Flexibacter flexilis DSM 6793]
MKYRKHSTLLFWALAWHIQAAAQNERVLPSVQVETSKLLKPVGFKVQNIDSADLAQYRTQTLADLLTYKTPVFIKNYGIGGLASPSFRGTASHHTQLLWNGLPINSPLLGSVDLSLLPVDFVEEIGVAFGGGSTLSQSSGGLGGAVLLNNIAYWPDTFSLQNTLYAGSYGQLGYRQRIGARVGRFYLSNKSQISRADNDFSFTNTEKYGSPTEKFSNAGQRQHGMMQDIFYQISPKQSLSAHGWYQWARRELGSPMLADGDEQLQKDLSVRGLVEWRNTSESQESQVRVGYFRENYDYSRHITQSPITLTDHSQSHIWLANAAQQWQNTRWQLKIGGNTQYEKGFYASQKEAVTQWRTGIYTDFIFNFNQNIKTSLTARQELTDHIFSPFLPSLGAQWRVWSNAHQQFLFKGNIARNYRQPTLNERFRVQGQTALLPEKHQIAEVGAHWSRATNKAEQNAEITAYESVTNDWIVWQRQGRSGLSRPENLKKVQVRGVEVSTFQQYRLRAWRVAARAAYNLVLSRNLQAYSGLDASVGKQMIYMPRHSAQWSINVFYKDFSLSVENCYNSRRYTDTDNQNFLTPYQLTNVSVGYELAHGRNNLFFTLKINNILNETYQSVAYYPMPLRNGQVSVCYQWH